MQIDGKKRHMAHAEEHEIVVPGPSAEFHGSQGEGFWHVISARPGVNISFFDVINLRSESDKVHTEPCVSLIYMFAANGESWMLDSDGTRSAKVPMRPGRLYFTHASERVSGLNAVPYGTRMCGIDIRLSIDVWTRMTAGQAPLSLTRDHAYYQADCAGAWIGILPVSPEQRLGAKKLFEAAQAGNQDLQVEARCLDLVNSAISSLVQAPAGNQALARDRHAVEIVKERIASGLDHDWSVADLACEAGISIKRLKTVFPAHTGMPVYRYLQEARLTHAKQMLNDGGHRVTDVALSVGYASLSHFATLFKRRFGMSPSQYGLLKKAEAENGLQ